MERLIPVLGQQIRVNVREGTGVPLVLCNGIGASLEVLDPLVEHLDPDTTVVRFDVPGTGGSPNSPLPYGFPYLAAVLGRLLKKLGLNGKVDVLGVSWGGALAQQFAFQNPRRCRRLILVSTGTGALMVPGGPAVLAKMLTPRRFLDHEYARLYRGRALRWHCAHRSVPRQAVVRPPADGRFAGGLPSSAACGSGVDQPVRLAADPPADADRRRARRPDHARRERQDHGAVAAACDGCICMPAATST